MNEIEKLLAGCNGYMVEAGGFRVFTTEPCETCNLPVLSGGAVSVNFPNLPLHVAEQHLRTFFQLKRWEKLPPDQRYDEDNGQCYCDRPTCGGAR